MLNPSLWLSGFCRLQLVLPQPCPPFSPPRGPSLTCPIPSAHHPGPRAPPIPTRPVHPCTPAPCEHLAQPAATAGSCPHRTCQPHQPRHVPACALHLLITLLEAVLPPRGSGNPPIPAGLNQGDRDRERPRETFFNTSRGQVPLPGLESNDALPLATRVETRIPWCPTRGSLTSPSYLVRNRTLGPPLENHPETPPSSRR